MSDPLTPALFAPLKAGAFDLSHRVVLPAMRRRRAEAPGGVPGDLMATFYAQRTTRGGLLVTETAWMHPSGHADGREPGLYSPEQVNAWRTVTGAVHGQGGAIVAQLGDAPFLHADPLQPGALALDVDAALRRARDAAECAGDAGFDGIELLATVPELFFHDLVQPRGDEYSGNLQNRTRLLMDFVHTLGGVWPAGRIGLRLSAVTPAMRVRQPDAMDALRMAVSAAFSEGIAYVHIGPPWPAEPRSGSGPVLDTLAALRGSGLRADAVLIASGSFDRPAADLLLHSGGADAVAFGRPFMANPDLPWRLRHGVPLTPWSEDDDAGQGAAGYTDFPVSEAAAQRLTAQDVRSAALRCDEGPWSPDPR